MGQVIWCLVQKATKIDTANTVVLNAKPEIIFQKSYKTGELQSLLPGMKVEFTITKVSMIQQYRNKILGFGTDQTSWGK